jgi:RNA polymerase sigma factor (sigma-70 family)
MWKDITTLCESYYRELQRFLLRRVHSPDIAADLTQETYLRLLRAHNTEKIEDVRDFLFTIASNLARDHLRQRSRLNRLDGGPLHPSFPSTEVSVEAKVEAQQQVDRLQQAMEELAQAKLPLDAGDDCPGKGSLPFSLAPKVEMRENLWAVLSCLPHTSRLTSMPWRLSLVIPPTTCFSPRRVVGLRGCMPTT